MATLQDIRKRVASVKNTQKITRAMKMVAAAKLRRSQLRLQATRPYADQLNQLMARLAAGGAESTHPLMTPHAEVKVARLIILSSDRGFCGGFNSNLLRRSMEWLVEQGPNYERIDIHVIGRKGKAFFDSRKIEIAEFETGVYEDFDLGHARKRADQLIHDYIDGQWDECYFAYNQFKSAISQEVIIKQLIPLTDQVGAAGTTEEAVDDQDSNQVEYLYEPEAPELLGDLLPRYVTTGVLRFFLESIASELGSRMVAMDAATGNCSDMIDRLLLMANRLRQAAITNELMDIVNGAESLKKSA